MEIFIDNIIFSLQKGGGISVVWKNLLMGITNNPDINFHCIEYDGAEDNIFRKEIQINITIINKKSSRLLFLKRYLNFSIKRKDIFLFHSSYYRTCTSKKAINITTVHDFTYEYYASWLKKRIHSWQKLRAVQNSDYIICISENTKKDLLKFLPSLDKKKIKVIYNGVSDDYYPLKDKSEYRTPFVSKSYLLFVGSREPYKNFNYTVELIKHTPYNLIIVGNQLSSKEISFLNHTIGSKKYFYAGRVSNFVLNSLFKFRK